MAPATTNPDLLLHHYLWRNRVQHWRAQPAESLFSTLALAAFIGLGLWIADPQWTALLHRDAAWARPLPATVLGLALAAMLLLRARARRSVLARDQRDDWLAALPIAPTLRQQARRQRVTRASVLTAIGIVLALAWAAARVNQPASGLLFALVAGALGGGLATWFLPEGDAAPKAQTRTRAVAVAVPPATQGLALLGAALEPAVARLPRGAPWVAGCFMLLPPSTPAIAVPGLVLLFTAASLAFDLVAHWRTRYLADQQWLAALPLPPTRLFGAYLAALAKRGTLLALLIGACLHALGAPAWFSWLLALALWLLLADAVLCAFATRRAPWRFPVLLTLHGLILLSTLQVLPPALPLVLGACAWTAWRRGKR